MSQPRSIPLAALALVLTFVGSARPAQNAQTRKLNEDFQAAVAQYDAGHFAEATVQLEKLLPSAPQSFEIHELLGLVYSAQQLDEKANPHFEKAVRLNPGSAAAHANFAINLVRLGRLELAAAQFRKAVALDPGNFDANHNLGELYVRSGKLAQAVPYLEKAQQIDSGSYDNGYDLALAYLLTGRLDNARILVQQLLRRKNAAELHNLLAEIEEKDGKFIAAVNEYEEAAHMEPSESNLFDWGSELLLHRTLDPAIEVLQEAVERYPQSQRLRIALGEQVRHLHAGERFEQRRDLRGDFGHVAGEFVGAGGIAIARGDDGDLVHLAERFAERANNLGQAGEEFVDHGGLVVLLEGFRLDVHGLGFGFALLEDDFGFGFALCAGGGGAAFRFGHQALAFGVGQRLDALALDFGLLEDGGNEFAFAPGNFGFLDFDLGFAFDLLDADGFRDHLLLFDVGFDFVGFIGLRLGALGGFQEAGFLDVEIALGFGLLGEGSGFRGDALLVRLGFRHGGGASGFGALDGNVALGFGGGNLRVALDAGDIRP